MKTTPNVLHFDEAISWFRHRLESAGYLPDVEGMLKDLEKEAGAVAATAQLDLATAVYEGLDEAISKGTTFNDFRQRIIDVLNISWGAQAPNVETSPRLDAIFRTNVQRSYNAGRIEQYRQPDILATRPYWKFSAILDGRTSELCQACAGVIRPADDAWWETHQPPLHHRCRSTVIAMSKRAGEAVGVTEDPPEGEVPEGFGNVEREFRPKLSEYPRALAKEYKGPR